MTILSMLAIELALSLGSAPWFIPRPNSISSPRPTVNARKCPPPWNRHPAHPREPGNDRVDVCNGALATRGLGLGLRLRLGLWLELGLGESNPTANSNRSGSMCCSPDNTNRYNPNPNPCDVALIIRSDLGWCILNAIIAR